MNGILLIDKPAGWTSHDVIAKLRVILKEKRIGHTGTLDPMATGLLVVLVGRATRAASFAEADEKKYIAGIRLGVTTDTQDITGTKLREEEAHVSDEELDRVLEKFTGEQMQMPPMYSAVKIGGQKLVDAARKGKEIERTPRKINIYELRRSVGEGEDPYLYVHCSKGTYVRTLCHDIGEELGCGACLSFLRRISAGPFSIVDAYRVGEVNCEAALGAAEELLLPVDTIFEQYPTLTLDAEQERRCRVGAEFRANAEDGRLRVYSADGEFLALVEAQNGVVRTVKNFFEIDEA